MVPPLNSLGYPYIVQNKVRWLNCVLSQLMLLCLFFSFLFFFFLLSDLAKGGCMSDFRWNQGSEFKGRKWDQDLPSDAAVSVTISA